MKDAKLPSIIVTHVSYCLSQGRNMDEKRLTDNDYVMPAVGADLGVAAVSR